MAEVIANFMDRIQLGDDESHQIAIGSSAFGVCPTEASATTKLVNIPGFDLKSGTTVHIQFIYANSAASPLLKISDSQAKNIVDDSTTLTNNSIIQWSAGAVLTFTYDGTNWVKNGGGGGAGGVSSWNDLTDKPTTISGFGITDASIDNGVITLGNETITPVTSVNEHTGSSITITAADLGLENAIHFVGVATVAITNGGTEDPLINGQTYLQRGVTAQSGDLVIDMNNEREYIWVDNAWLLLGFTADTVYATSTNEDVDVPTWVAGITQYTDGTVRASLKTLGTLGIGYGGTGATSFTDDAVILTETVSNVMRFTSRAYSDSDSAAAIGTSTNFVTERDIYYGLPKINYNHTYTQEDDIYVPLSSGAQYQLLVSGGYNSAPTWATAAKVQSAASTTPNTAAYTTLILGNNIAVTSDSLHSEGKIEIFSAGSEGHTIDGASTSVAYTHTLPNATGYIVQIPSSSAVGSNVEPVYIADNGVATVLTYTPNRLYYSDVALAGETYAINYIAGTYFANGTQLGVNITEWPLQNLDNFYVSGGATFTGAVKITDSTNSTGIQDGALVVTGGAQLGGNLFIGGDTDITGDLNVTGTSKLTSYVGIGADPTSDYMLYVEGETYHSDDITFAQVDGITLVSPKLIWSGDETASIYYRADVNNEYFVIEGNKLVFNDTIQDTLFLDIPNQNFYPYDVDEYGKAGSLGLGGPTGTARRWSSVYIGTADTYGDPYLPVYWNEGVPTPNNGVVQYKAFSFATDATTCTIDSVAYDQHYGFHTYVQQIVVTEGMEYLNGPISSATTQQSEGVGRVTLTTAAVSGTVSGYIITARGVEAPTAASPTPSGGEPSGEDPGTGGDEPGTGSEEPGSGNGEDPGSGGGENPNSSDEPSNENSSEEP